MYTLFFIVYAIAVVPIPPRPPLRTTPPCVLLTSTVIPHTIVYVHGSFICVIWLVPPLSFNQSPTPSSPSFFLSSPEDIFIKFYREKKGGTGRERERSVASCTCPIQDWKSNPWTFGAQDDAPMLQCSNQPSHSGQGQISSLKKEYRSMAPLGH